MVLFPISPWPAGQRSAHCPRWQKLDRLHDLCLQKPKAIPVVELAVRRAWPFQPQLHQTRGGWGAGRDMEGKRRGERVGKGKGKGSWLTTWKHFGNFEWKKSIYTNAKHQCSQCELSQKRSKLGLSYFCATSHNKTWLINKNPVFFFSTAQHVTPVPLLHLPLWRRGTTAFLSGRRQLFKCRLFTLRSCKCLSDPEVSAFERSIGGFIPSLLLFFFLSNSLPSSYLFLWRVKEQRKGTSPLCILHRDL